jgi:hypothetical protein
MASILRGSGIAIEAEKRYVTSRAIALRYSKFGTPSSREVHTVTGAAQPRNGGGKPAGAKRRLGRTFQGRVTNARAEGNQLPYQGESAKNRRGDGVRAAVRNAGAKRIYPTAGRVQGSGTWIRTTVD